MLISALYDMISEHIPCRLIQNNGNWNLTHFSFLNKDMSLTNEKCLYIGTLKNAPETSSPIVLLTTMIPEHISDKYTVFLISPEHYAECLNVVTRLFFHEQEREDEFNRLISHPVDQTPFHEIINNAAIFMDRTLLLADLSFHVVDHSTSRPVTDPVWKTNIKRGFASYEFVEAMNALIPENSLPTTTEPFFVSCFASKENRICSLLFYNQRPIGYLVLLDNEKGIYPYHLQYLPRISQMLTLALKHLPNFQSLFINASENAFLQILEGKSADSSFLKMLNSTLQLPKAMRCLVIVPKNDSKHDLFYLQRNLYSLFPAGSIFIYQKRIIAIVSDEDSRLLSNPDFCKGHAKNIKEVGVSSSFRSIQDFPTYLAYAQDACTIANRLGQNEFIHYYDDYQFFHILSTCSNEKLLRAYIHPSFDILHEYDLANDTTLLNTLQSYITNGLNAKETATALYLHRNTLTYRLNKIKALTDIDFEDLETIFRLSCSFRINQLLQIF